MAARCKLNPSCLTTLCYKFGSWDDLESLKSVNGLGAPKTAVNATL